MLDSVNKTRIAARLPCWQAMCKARSANKQDYETIGKKYATNRKFQPIQSETTRKRFSIKFSELEIYRQALGRG